MSALLAAAKLRQRQYVAAGGSARTFAAGVRALVGAGRTDSEAWLAAGVLVDVQAGLCPSGALPPPPAWRTLPPEVQAVLGLPAHEAEWWARWTEGRRRLGLDAVADAARDATIAAAEAEMAGDEAGRELFAEVALRRCAAALREIRSPRRDR